MNVQVASSSQNEGQSSVKFILYCLKKKSPFSIIFKEQPRQVKTAYFFLLLYIVIIQALSLESKPPVKSY